MNEFSEFHGYVDINWPMGLFTDCIFLFRKRKFYHDIRHFENSTNEVRLTCKIKFWICSVMLKSCII